jgi:CAAX prenyl protease-like protein
MFEPAFLQRALPFAAYLLFIFIADVLLHVGWTEDQLRWLYPVKIGVVALLLFSFRRAYLELHLTSNWRLKRHTQVSQINQASHQPHYLLAIITGAAVFVAWINLSADWMKLGDSAGFDPRIAGQIDWRLVLPRLVGAALIVPIMEELFWRSLLLRWITQQDFLTLKPAFIGLNAFVITALLFAFEHHLWLAGLVAGISYNWLYMRSGSLWTVVIAHAVTNGLLGVWVIYSGNWHYW